MITKDGFLSRIKRKAYYCEALGETVNIRAMGAKETGRFRSIVGAENPDTPEYANAVMAGGCYVVACGVENEDRTPLFDGENDEVLQFVGEDVIMELTTEICLLSGIGNENEADAVADPLGG